MTEYLNRLKQKFAWDNDEYNISEEEIPHANISADFPGIALDHNDAVEPISELYEETAEEMVQRVSRTTGVPAHGAGTTGVQGTDLVGIVLRHVSTCLTCRHLPKRVPTCRDIQNQMSWKNTGSWENVVPKKYICLIHVG